MSELRTDSREWVHRIMRSLDRMLVGIENLAVGNRPVLGGERYLTFFHTYLTRTILFQKHMSSAAFPAHSVKGLHDITQPFTSSPVKLCK